MKSTTAATSAPSAAATPPASTAKETTQEFTKPVNLDPLRMTSWGEKHIQSSIDEFESILKMVVIDYIQEFKKQEYDYQSRILQRLSSSASLKLSSIDFDSLNRIVEGPVLAEGILDKLLSNKWLEIDDRVTFLKSLPLKLPENSEYMNALNTILNQELSSLDSTTFLGLKQAKFSQVCELVTKLRSRMQRFIDTIPVVTKGIHAAPEVDLYEKELNLVARIFVPGNYSYTLNL
jgi:hypothetical protein